MIDPKKIAEEDYLEWLKRELGSDAGLVDFAKYFLHLFSEKHKGAATQKKLILSLYAKYAPEIGGDWKGVTNLPAADREEFEKVWDPEFKKRFYRSGQRGRVEFELGLAADFFF